jgi:hypothetical protein
VHAAAAPDRAVGHTDRDAGLLERSPLRRHPHGEIRALARGPRSVRHRIDLLRGSGSRFLTAETRAHIRLQSHGHGCAVESNARICVTSPARLRTRRWAGAHGSLRLRDLLGMGSGLAESPTIEFFISAGTESALDQLRSVPYLPVVVPERDSERSERTVVLFGITTALAGEGLPTLCCGGG